MQRALRAGIVPGILLVAAFLALGLPRLLDAWLDPPGWQDASNQWASRIRVASVVAGLLLAAALVAAAAQIRRGPRAGAIGLAAVVALAVGGALLAAGPWHDAAALARVDERYTAGGTLYAVPASGFGELQAGVDRAVRFEAPRLAGAAPAGGISLGVLPRVEGDLWQFHFYVEDASATRLLADGLDCEEMPTETVGPDGAFRHSTFRTVLCVARSAGASEVRIEGAWPDGARHEVVATSVPMSYFAHGSSLDERAFALGVSASLAASGAAAVLAPRVARDERRAYDAVSAAGLGAASLAWGAVLATRAEAVGSGRAAFLLLALVGAGAAFALAALWWRAPSRATQGLALTAAGCVATGALLSAPTVAAVLPTLETFTLVGALGTVVVAALVCVAWWPRLADGHRRAAASPDDA